MMTRRHPLLLSCLAMLCASTIFGSACNRSDNNLTVEDQPALRLETPSSGEIPLQLPIREREPLELGEIIVVSSGEVPLTITSVEWVGDKPDRVFMASSREEDVLETECDSPIYYPASDICVLTGAPDFSEPVAAGTQFGVQLHVAAYDMGEPNVINCPEEIPTDVPEEFREEYCGAIRITSDARNDTSFVTKGATTVYLQADRSSGQLMLTVPTITFENVTPGLMTEKTFGVVNQGTSSLSISRVVATSFGQYLSVEGPDLPLELEPLAVGEFTVKLNIPPSENPDLLDFTAQIQVESTAPTSPHLLDVVVDNSRQLPPVPTPDRQKISFDADGDVQSIVIGNTGDLPVSLTGIIYEPASAEDYYEFLDAEEEPFVGPSVIQSDGDKTYNIRYTAPTNGDAGLASMIINYNYFVGDLSKNGSVRLILLGDQTSVAFGDVVPSIATFSTETMDEQTRRAAIYNLGNAPLEVTMADFMDPALAGTRDEFVLTFEDGATLPLTIPADGIQPFTISFIGTNSDVDRFNVTFNSDSAVEDAMVMTLSSQNLPPPAEELTFTASFLDDKARVGELASVSFGSGVSAPVAANAEWVILERPAASTVYFKTIGPEAAFVPDVAGKYQVLATSSSGGIDVQNVYTFTAE